MSMLIRMLTKKPVITALGALLLIEVFSVTMIEPMGVSLDTTVVSEGERLDDAPLKISEIDGPRIDDTAASVVVSKTRPLPGEAWVFLWLAYVALLVFNFSSTFERVVAPQWGWEMVYTLVTLWGWLVLDPALLYTWFPLIIIKSGLIIFALYAYLLEQRLAAPHVHR